MAEVKDNIIRGADEYILRKQGCPASEFTYTFEIVKTKSLSEKQSKQINQLWNDEYPQKLKDRFPILLDGAENHNHYIIEDTNKNVIAWAVNFEKEKQIRFSVIVSSSYKRKGLARLLIDKLKKENEELYGWVIDHNDDLKTNGAYYQTPLPFYIELGFEILSNVRLDNDMIKAVLIKSRKNENRNY